MRCIAHESLNLMPRSDPDHLCSHVTGQHVIRTYLTASVVETAILPWVCKHRARKIGQTATGSFTSPAFLLCPEKETFYKSPIKMGKLSKHVF